MAVPKKKTARSATKWRRSIYIRNERKRLLNQVKLVKCKETWVFTLNHRVSPSWFYKWVEILKKKEKNKAAQVIQA